MNTSSKRKADSDSEEDKPLMARAPTKKVKKEVKKRKTDIYDDEEDEDLKPVSVTFCFQLTHIGFTLL